MVVFTVTISCRERQSADWKAFDCHLFLTHLPCYISTETCVSLFIPLLPKEVESRVYNKKNSAIIAMVDK